MKKSTRLTVKQLKEEGDVLSLILRLAKEDMKMSSKELSQMMSVYEFMPNGLLLDLFSGHGDMDNKLHAKFDEQVCLCMVIKDFKNWILLDVSLILLG
ncbi:hypothetical protein BUALT_Bualt11G0052500 [Buddleja alternifolia]|uniref:Uncharacterized protein n=1 Tax=Buddleja alternifolia TaxID=168488 RepID=A0AAV6X3B7_9LAMI|nr:hypothetical protein BUALT_Bualt11G0052500 [Buddleja alternifolia]